MTQPAIPSSDGLYPIRTVCQLTGVHPVTLRAWERRYGLVSPQRTAKGHRLYTEADVDRIHRVLALLEQGVPVSRVRPLLDADTGAPREKTTDRGVAPFEDYEGRMLSAAREFDEKRLEAIYNDALSLYPISLVTERLTTPVLRALGETWREDEAGIACEHFFSTFLRNKIGARFAHVNRDAAGPRLLAACPAGEHHELGLLQFALAAATAGNRVVLVGTDLPAEQIAAAARVARCRAVVLSVSSGSGGAALGRLLAEVVSSARVPVLVGGEGSIRHRGTIETAGALAVGAGFAEALATLGRALANAGAGNR